MGELTDFQVGQLIEDPDGRLWALPEYGGTPSIIDPATGRAETAPGLAEFRVYALAFAGDATWAGTSDGLLRFKGGSQRLLNQAGGLPADEVTTLQATPGTLWIGTTGGLAGYDLTTGQITGTVEALAGHVVDAMLLAPDGALWVGSHWGDDGSQSALDRFAGSEHRRWSVGEPPFGAGPALGARPGRRRRRRDLGLAEQWCTALERPRLDRVDRGGRRRANPRHLCIPYAQRGHVVGRRFEPRYLWLEQPGRLATHTGAHFDGRYRCLEGDPRRDALASHQRWSAALWTVKSTRSACPRLIV